jgi:hypothetical protein
MGEMRKEKLSMGKEGLTINQMRSYILDHYPDATEFRRTVVDMPTKRVVAIYRSLRDRKKATKTLDYHQMDIWEWLVMQNERCGTTGTHSEIRV